MRTILLDTKNRVLAVPTIYIGSLNTSMIRVGELFREAIKQNCAAIIVAHNHPSADPTPSAEDLQVTTQIVEAGKLLDIEVLDHLIIGRQRYLNLPMPKGRGFRLLLRPPPGSRDLYPTTSWASVLAPPASAGDWLFLRESPKLEGISFPFASCSSRLNIARVRSDSTPGQSSLALATLSLCPYYTTIGYQMHIEMALRAMRRYIPIPKGRGIAPQILIIILPPSQS